ncbi:hypothetical protein [Teichococcus vastitatis]|uniref:Uncharacterized protein n=1 Tax=Teichococcus vastitatis TaxID=2307076 RepID=A0ABS9W635_9PROT|nr:hypothetical protein [Pseudoroseomonas vastitatis]MCI0754752.1 hypothetical protein [Pseudoroseomonas vastitatis]
MRRALLLAGLALPPLLTQPAIAQRPDNASPALQTAAPTGDGAVRVRTGQHNDRGRVVLHLGTLPAYELRRSGQDHELWLRGRYQLNLTGQRPLSELTGMETRQEGAFTVLRLRPACDCVAETGAFDGMLYVDLRPSRTAREPVSPAQLAAARRRLLDDAVRLGLLGQDQAIALLRGGRLPEPAAEASPAVVSSPVPDAAPLPSAPIVAVMPLELPSEPVVSSRIASAAPSTSEPPRDEMARLRETLISRLAILNGTSAPPAVGSPVLSSPGPAAAAPQPIAATATAAAAPPLPNPSFPPPPETAHKPVCTASSFSLAGWAGTQSFTEDLVAVRNLLAESDQGALETAALAEFYVGRELPREALEVLSNRPSEWPAGEVRERLERVRDVARLLGRQPVDVSSPLLMDAADCARPDLPLWRGLQAAVQGNATMLAQIAPRIRAALREVPAELRLAFVGILADAVDEDAESMRTLLGALRGPGGAITQPRPDQLAARALLLARLARTEGNRAEELQQLEAAVAQGGHSLPALQARIRLAALQFGRPGTEGRQAELTLLDASRTYRFDSLGEEAAVLYAQRLLERGDAASALAVADGASQAALRPSTESRGARLAAQALRLLLVDAKGMALPPPGERLALFWQYEGYATPGERGDDIRQGMVRLLLSEGLSDAALDVARQLTPATLQQPAGALLVARAEALAQEGDARRAMALLRSLPPSPEMHRAASVALARLGQPREAAQELSGLDVLADRQRRAGLLFQAQAWSEAASAYAELLRDPTLEPAVRTEATHRLAAAAALAGGKPDVPADLLAADPGIKALLQLSGNAQASPHGVTGARAAIARSREVEKLLSATGNN